MFDALLDVLGNAHFEGYVGGPIAGVVAGAIFTALGNRPNDGAGPQTPREIYTHIVEYRFRYEQTERRGASRSNDDGSALIGVGLLVLVLCFLFVAYLPQISAYIYFLTAAVSTFTIFTCIFGILTRQFQTFAWWRHTIFPSVISLICFYTITVSENAIDTRVVASAHSLLSGEHLTLAQILSGAVTFYKSLSNDYTKWIIHQMAAFSFSLLAVLEAFLMWIHYVALANARVSQSGLWVALVFHTRRFSGMSAMVTATVFTLLAWLFASGKVFDLF